MHDMLALLHSEHTSQHIARAEAAIVLLVHYIYIYIYPSVTLQYLRGYGVGAGTRAYVRIPTIIDIIPSRCLTVPQYEHHHKTEGCS